MSSKRTPSKKSSGAGPKPAKAPNADAPLIFLPTLLPDPFGESSPELCWERISGERKISLKLTQFGWTASAFRDGLAFKHWSEGSLDELRSSVLSNHPGAGFEELAAAWVLAYEASGFKS